MKFYTGKKGNEEAMVLGKAVSKIEMALCSTSQKHFDNNERAVF